MTIVLGPGEGRFFGLGPDRITVKGVTNPGDAGFALIDYTAAPGVPGPPLHVHEAIDEAWFLLEGELEVQIGDDRRRVDAGSFLLVPRLVPHTFANAGSGPARWVGVLSPAEALGMLEDLGRLVPEDGPPDERAMMEVFARYKTSVLGPPLGLPGTSPPDPA
jgi:mannose-6-phosphate isomerase-like protein (cupin superfamily)